MPSMSATDQNLVMSFFAQFDRKSLFTDADYDKIMKDLKSPTIAAVKARWMRLYALCTEMYAKGEKFDAGATTNKSKATLKKRNIDASTDATDSVEVPATPTKKPRTKKVKAKNVEEVEAAAVEENNGAANGAEETEE